MSARETAIVAARGARAALGLGAWAVLAMAGFARAAEAPSKAQLERGKELFVREWMAGDTRSHGGDGLGPVYNDTSCVACHNSGTTGGGGPNSKNVDIVSAFPNQNIMQAPAAPRAGFVRRAFEALLGIEEPAPDPTPRRVKPDTGPLIKAHAGFRTSRSVVLHRFGADPAYDAWRGNLIGMAQFGMSQNNFDGMPAEQRGQLQLQQVRLRMQMASSLNQMQNQVGMFTLSLSHRNPTALFGAGLIDAIPDDVLIAAAKQTYADMPEIAGRVSRLKNGKIGRFGWKGQTPSLEDFVLTACAVELGLEVPGHPQAGLPQAPEAKAKGLDLDAQECASLTAFVKSLPRPVVRAVATDAEAKARAEGERLFTKVGCAACHMPKLGEVEGIYSDLLLHDLGPDLADTGQYGVFVPDSSDPDFVDPEDAQQPAEGPVTMQRPVSAVVAAAAPATDLTPPTPPTPLAGPQVRTEPILAPPTPALPAVETAPQVLPAPTAVTVETEVGLGAAPPVPPAHSSFLPDLLRFVGPVHTFVTTRTVLAMPAPFAEDLFIGQATPTTPTRPKNGPATRQEWRTPPLWGFRDSGPYMHDGRAQTLDQAVAVHGGEADRSAQMYFSLSLAERQQIQTFLKSLVAPSESAPLASAAR